MTSPLKLITRCLPLQHAVVAASFILLFSISPDCSAWAAPNDPAPGENISIEVKDQPLSAVLDKLSEKTAYTFSVDERWLDYPISVAFQNLSLEAGLKRILGHFNHVVIQQSDTDFKIVIYEEKQAVSSAGSTPYRPAYQPPIPSYRQDPASEPEPELDPEPAPDDDADSDQEVSPSPNNEAGSEKE